MSIQGKSKKIHGYFLLKKDQIAHLDNRIRRMGFANRSDFFEAVIAVTLGNTPDHIIPNRTQRWLSSLCPACSEEDLMSVVQRIIDTTLKPVIAIRGRKVAFESTWRDVRSLVFDETGIMLSESELQDAYFMYEIMNKSALRDYCRETVSPPDEGV